MGNLDVAKFREIYETHDEYKEVRENEKMKHPHILCLSGSHAYGTAREDSDIDLRGIVNVNKSIAIGASMDWETQEFRATDTTIYSYKKFIQLIIKGNPSIICLLGNDLDDYLVLSKEGRELVTKYDGLLLSKQVHDSFIGYSVEMLKRLELAELGMIDQYGDKIDKVTVDEKKVGILDNHISLFSNRYKSVKQGNVEADFEIIDDEVYVKSFSTKDVSMVDFFDMAKDLKNVSSSFGKKGKRNKKKTEFKLNKHCMHLVRGLLMGNELLETGKVVTYRKNDLDLLHDILNGKFMGTQGKMHSSFYELVDELKAKADYAYKNTVLPREVDKEKLEYFYTIFLESSLNLKERIE